MEWRYAVFLTIFIFTCVYATWNNIACETALPEAQCLLSVEAVKYRFKNLKRNNKWENMMTHEVRMNMVGQRRLLGGPGSSPPQCNLKCGKCRPCKPVLVPISPGRRLTADYYPEAWRCKCGNKLYKP
ncbi:hypothetical protein OROGR_013506 [Orobanche gracilis]